MPYWTVVLLLLTSTLTLTSTSTSTCPTTIGPLCSCEHHFGGLQLRCVRVELGRVTAALLEANQTISRLIVRYSNISMLERGILPELDVKELDLSQNNISNVAEDAFDNVTPQLEELILSKNNLTTFPNVSKLRNLRRLSLNDNQLTNIPEGVFKLVTKLKQLELGNNRICELQKNVLNETSKMLELLDLSGNCFDSIPAQNLRGQQYLMHLDLSNNNLSSIPIMQFMNLPRLTGLRLDNNRISHVHSMAFMNVPNLELLYLRNNRIPSIEANRFEVFQQLQVLDLGGNKITKVQVASGAFKEIQNLKQLFLDNNSIETVQTLSFSSNKRLQMISLLGNRIRSLGRNCFYSLPGMTTLLLQNNKLEYLEPAMLSGVENLLVLNLHSNNLTTIHSNAFHSLTKLTSLDLGDNRLNVLPKALFEPMRQLFWLDLCCNNISTFGEGTFTRKISNILLDNNPLHCNESINWLIEYLVENKVRTFLPNQGDVTCSGPPKYSGVRLKHFMIKKANDTHHKMLERLSLEGATTPLGNLLPTLQHLPGLHRGIPFFTTTPQPRIKEQQSRGAINRASGLQSTLQRALSQPGGIAKLMRRLPPNSELRRIRPELVEFILRGGSIPGVPKEAVNQMIRKYMEELSQLDVQQTSSSSAGTTTITFTATTETPVTLSPNELLRLRSLLTNLTAASGVTTAATQSNKPRIITVPPPNTGDIPKLITGIPPLNYAALLNRLPANFNLSRIPTAIQRQIAVGKQPDLSLLPADVLNELLAQQQKQSKSSAAPPSSAAGSLPAAKGVDVRPTFRPYDIRVVDSQNDPRSNRRLVWAFTVPALLLVGLATALLLLFFCWRHCRNRRMRKADSVEKSSFVVASQASPNCGGRGRTEAPAGLAVQQQRELQHRFQPAPPATTDPYASTAIYATPTVSSFDALRTSNSATWLIPQDPRFR